MTKLNKFLCIAAIFMSVVSASASTAVPANITANQVWTAANSPYIVSNNVLINTGVSVKVMPGVTIQSTGNFKIIVNGEFAAIGTYDSVIIMDKMQFEFTNGCVGYDFLADVGSTFKYCMFYGDMAFSIYTITLNTVPMMISNCKFLNCYYTLYVKYTSLKDTVYLKVLNSIFDCNNSNYGYAVNNSDRNTFLEMDGCLIRNQYGLILSNYSNITRCSFLNTQSYSAIRIPNSSKFNPGETYFKCNIFRKGRNSFMEMLGVDSFMKLEIEDNTFDSCDNFITVSYMGQTSCRPLIKNNNFLTHKNYVIKYSGGTPGVSDLFDLKNNYWNTTDTNLIKAAIYDHVDDITVTPLADYSGYRTTPSVSCIENSSVAQLEKVNFSLYPNPATNSFTARFKEYGSNTVRIYNLMGESVYEGETAENELTLEISSLSNGLYIVEVISADQKTGMQKLVINR